MPCAPPGWTRSLHVQSLHTLAIVEYRPMTCRERRVVMVPSVPSAPRGWKRGVHVVLLRTLATVHCVQWRLRSTGRWLAGEELVHDHRVLVFLKVDLVFLKVDLC